MHKIRLRRKSSQVLRRILTARAMLDSPNVQVFDKTFVVDPIPRHTNGSKSPLKRPMAGMELDMPKKGSGKAIVGQKTQHSKGSNRRTIDLSKQMQVYDALYLSEERELKGAASVIRSLTMERAGRNPQAVAPKTSVNVKHGSLSIRRKVKAITATKPVKP